MSASDDETSGSYQEGADPTTTIKVCPDGPLLVRGDFEVVDVAGNPIPRQRRTVALCRCGASANKPWCDASHQATKFSAP